MKDHLSKKNTWNYDIFCVSEKMEVIPLFPTNFALPFCKKSKDDLLTKIITEKDDVHPKKYSISADRKIKDDKKICEVNYI